MSDEPTVIIITGGLPGEVTHARVGNVQIDRKAGETLEEFKVRAIESAKAWGVPEVVIGGLPDR